MTRQLLSVAWGVSIGAALVTFILSVGSTLSDLTLTLAIAAMIFGSIALIGIAVFEIESRAFKRGWNAHGEEEKSE